MDYLLNTLAKLVSIDTNSSEKKNYEKCAKLIDSEAKKLGMKSRIISFRGKDGKKRPNVIAEKNVGAKETVLLLAHFDVVPAIDWLENPFAMRRKGNVLFARGIADDKGGIASCLSAVKNSKSPSRNIKFLCVCDEESGGFEGIGLLVKKNPFLLKADFCVAIDGGLDWVSNACSGVAKIEINFSGKGGHAGYDFETTNVLHKTIAFLEELKGFKKVRESKKSFINAPKNPVSKKMFGRFNITAIHAGSQPNVIPSEVSVLCDMRLLPEEKPQNTVADFKKLVLKIAKKHSLKPRIRILTAPGYYSVDEKYSAIVKTAAEKSVSKKLPLVSEFGGTDSRYVSLLKIPSFTFGPGGKNLHSNNESITISELKKTEKFVKNLIG